ncbi:MAG: dihydroorotase family protein [Gammaproteobacteria bacterium]|nr:dihydroorotase family protein [Gammaproteobacteria bacterium]
MITITGAKSISGQPLTLTCANQTHQTIDATGLIALPGLIDPHVHFRTPGMEYKEDWRTGAMAAICGGYTTVFDMPNTIPPTISAALLQEKIALIDSQLKEVAIPLRYHLFFGADKKHFSEVHQVKNAVIGIKVFMGCSTGNLVIDDDESLHAIFAIAATQNLIVAVHAEDEDRLKSQKKHFQDQGALSYSHHSEIRDVQAACLAVAKAIELCRIYRTRLYILHVSTADEIALIKKAKEEGLPVHAETTPHHLFLNQDSYPQLQGRAVVNPPLRELHHNTALMEAIRAGIIDTIGSDHAPHTQQEKAKPYGECPSGMPGIETTLPLLLTAYHQGLLTLEHIVALTSTRAETIFGLPKTADWVLVDMDREAVVDPLKLKTKCAWSAFSGRLLRGWPIYTILKEQCFFLDDLRENR